MAKLWVAPTGRLSTGHVLDVARVPFERALRDYDPLLYVRWNPKKVRGWGCWEIRRRPEKKTVVRMVEFEGNTICDIGHREVDIVNHVLDAAFLNYDQLNKIKSMDTLNGNQAYYAEMLESKEKSYVAEQNRKRTEDMKYAARQYKTAIRDFKELVLSGVNPAQIADYWNKVGQKS